MGYIRERYGIQPDKISNFYHNWQNIRDNCEWECFDSFLFWCSTQEHDRGMQLRRHDTSQPHGPGNSFWYRRETAEEDCIFCKGCEKTCPNNGNGCDEWKEWFIKNWNENIHFKKKPGLEPVKKKNIREKFQYEHPDIVRENRRLGKEDPCETCVRLSECDGVDEDCPRRKR